MRRVLTCLVALALAAGLFLLGRASADRGPSAGQVASQLADGYARGLDDGRAAGLLEGRELQATLRLAASARLAARKAFGEGYAAGANDAFGGFDGGWRLGACYLVSLERGRGAITYRIASRAPAHAGCASR